MLLNTLCAFYARRGETGRFQLPSFHCMGCVFQKFQRQVDSSQEKIHGLCELPRVSVLGAKRSVRNQKSTQRPIFVRDCR
jgi:hypothetical protein